MHTEPRPDRANWEEWFVRKVLFSYCSIHKYSIFNLSPSFCSSYIDGSVRYGYRDYTNGLITTAVHILPVLRTDIEEAAIASNCIMNFGAFRDDAEFIHT